MRWLSACTRCLSRISQGESRWHCRLKLLQLNLLIHVAKVLTSKSATRQPNARRCKMRNVCVSLTFPPSMIRRGGELGVVFFRHATEPTSTLAKILYVVLRRHTHVAAVLCWRAAEAFCALLSKRNSGLVSVTHASHCSEWRAHRYLLATPRPAVRVHARQRGVHRACAVPPPHPRSRKGKKNNDRNFHYSVSF